VFDVVDLASAAPSYEAAAVIGTETLRDTVLSVDR
jgi:hypothetical protein